MRLDKFAEQLAIPEESHFGTNLRQGGGSACRSGLALDP